MMDVTLDILDRDPAYHSFTMDGHAIMIDDYLEVRPERRGLVEKLIRGGRLIVGPYFTLAEEFSVSHEALVRNLLWGRKTVEKYGGRCGTVAYTPSSWGQTGQLPQILADFGLKYMMFYRGVSHHECGRRVGLGGRPTARRCSPAGSPSTHATTGTTRSTEP